MNPVPNKVVSGELAASERSAEAIARYTETMSAVERLCLRSGQTLVALGKNENKGFYSFVRKMMVWTDDKEHPTTSAQCISAIQNLLRALDGIKLTQPEPANLPFMPLAKGKQIDGKWLQNLQKVLKFALEKQMHYLANPLKNEKEKKPEDADWIGQLNPFTCAHTLHALQQSEHLMSKECWTALFGLLWALRREYPNYEGAAGVAMPHSLPTAFVTSLCIDAIESLVQTLGRREGRLQCLIDLIAELEKLDSATLEKKYAPVGLVHQKTSLCQQIRSSIREIAQDAALNVLFTSWGEKLGEKGKFDIARLQECFIEAFKDCRNEISNGVGAITTTLKDLDSLIVQPIFKVVALIETKPGTTSVALTSLPDGLVELRYRNATDKYLSNSENPEWMKLKLSKYWKDHWEAAKEALKVCNGLHLFLVKVVTCYERVDSKSTLSVQLKMAAKELPIQREILQKLLKGAVSWSEGVMDHQLSLFRSAKMGEFDAAELAHAARTVSRSGASKHAAGVLESIDVICSTQNPDGNWPTSQPFFWTHAGVAAFPHSAEVAWALVSIMRTVVQTPETFGMGQSEALARLDTGNKTLRRYLDWLSATAHSYSLPELLGGESADKSRQIFGWGSDRTPEPDLVHAWATANVVEFLVEFRDLLQDQINLRLRIEFLSYHPSDLKRLKDFPTPDLCKDYEDRIGTWLRENLVGHIERANREAHWIARADYGGQKSNFFSAILAGPPGSAKSYLAKCIAGELGWPLIAFSPSDFLAAGEANVEARAREIFESLKSGSRVVYFFDEIDELIVDRAHTQSEQGRSVFSFLTPSFLTKLQDLRDAAEQKGFLFLIGTNYLDRIDSAAKRIGRIDRHRFILYPDKQSRRARILERLKLAFKEEKPLRVFLDRCGEKSTLTLIVEATALLSIPALDRVCTGIWGDYVRQIGDDAKWRSFDQIIEELRNDKSSLVKRDIDLTVYWGRPGAVDEWCEMMALVPKHDLEKELKGYVLSLRKRWNLHGERVILKINDVRPKKAWQTKKLLKLLDELASSLGTRSL